MEAASKIRITFLTKNICTCNLFWFQSRWMNIQLNIFIVPLRWSSTSQQDATCKLGQFAQTQVAGIVYRNICAVYGLQNSESQWNTCPKVVMNDRAEIHWDFQFQLTTSRLTSLWLTNHKKCWLARRKRQQRQSQMTTISERTSTRLRRLQFCFFPGSFSFMWWNHSHWPPALWGLKNKWNICGKQCLK